MRQVRAVLVVAAALTVCLAMAGCPVGRVPGADYGNIALDFSLPDSDETVHTLSQYLGRVVWIQFLLNHDCGQCELEALESMPYFYDIYASDGLVILAVLVGNDKNGNPMDRDYADNWKTVYGLDYPVLYDEGVAGGAWETYREERNTDEFYVPLNVFVDREGVIRYKSGEDEGYTPGGGNYKNVILSLLGE